MAAKLKIGLLGVGHLGKIHLKCILQTTTWELVGYFDPSDKNAAAISESYPDVRRFTTVKALLEAVDAVDIVTPTTTHAKLAMEALKAGKHIFIEKPLTQTTAQALRILKYSAAHPHLKIQVGHVERFNPAILALKHHKLQPMFVEGHRLAAFSPRGTDVSVVLDLMIHDIDLILHLIKSPVTRVSASGVAVMSHTPDIANARIEFANGAVANLTASRISMKQMRKMRLFQPDAYISIDFLEKNAQIVRLYAQDAANLPPMDQLMEFETPGGKKWLQLEMQESGPINAIQMELETFADSILNNTPPEVSVSDGYNALNLAHKILKCIDISLQKSIKNA